ncbi:MAG: amidohydrolase family protein [Clostridia bacterium]|nr:amidohydrolase family protein [Clostridia bacterium]
MCKIFDAHVHHLFEMPIEDAISIFKKEFPLTKTERQAFMSLPNEVSSSGEFYFDEMQNIRMLFLKYSFSPTAYAFAGLEHPLNVWQEDGEKLSKNYLRQASEYALAGYDGMKMLEGYPSMRKAMKRPLCDRVYDRYYAFLQENGIPITMHVANPEENWDITKADAHAISAGRVYDGSYPTRLALLDEVDGIMKKFPKLKLTLAHFGFLSYDIERARAFLDYENTAFDTTPGGEQLINMLSDWDEWQKVFESYQDKIIYGSDYYAFPMDESWEENFLRRPKFLREFFETDKEHTYLGKKFHGVNMDRKILAKIYWENAIKRLGNPKRIDENYLLQKAEDLLKIDGKRAEFADCDLRYIIQTVGCNK